MILSWCNSRPSVTGCSIDRMLGSNDLIHALPTEPHQPTTDSAEFHPKETR